MTKLISQSQKEKVEYPDVGVFIVARNEAKMIRDCLESVRDFGEVVVLDLSSSDDTKKISQDLGAKISELPWKGFDYATPRNKAKELISKSWILYLDADERLTPALRQEINQVIQNGPEKFVAHAIPRRNFILGKEFKHMGQWPDYVIRLFKRDRLKGWQGLVHEQPLFEGELGHLKNPMLHDKHETISEMVEKTNNWSNIEAKLLFDSNHPKMSWWRFVRIMVTELTKRLIVQKGYLDGTEGVFYSFYQTWSRFVTYAKLWEIQLEDEQENP
jgi:glycosyltransferase involved in cell wall biosynthesis